MISTDLTVLQPYCENHMRLLKKISKSIFLRLGEPLTEAEYDDFYSIATDSSRICTLARTKTE